MKRVLLLAEGQTEEAFAMQTLTPHFLSLGISIEATRIATRIQAQKRVYRGGHGRKSAHIHRDLLRLLGDSDAACITTFIDYYGLPNDFPGLHNRPAGNCYARVQHVERAFADDFNDRRFVPHLVLHEFEGLLLCCPAEIQNHFANVECRAALEALRRSVPSPEEIDESRDTSPFRRLASIVPGYAKRADGPLIAQRIGLPKMREHCPHFHEWLNRLEGLA